MTTRGFVLALVILLGSSPAQSPFIAGASSAARSDVEHGLLLIGELGCTACHAPGQAAPQLLPKSAPDLTRVGDRADPRWMIAFISDPQGTKAGTTMPHAVHARQAEDIVHWLMSRARRPLRPRAPDLGAAARGEELFHQVGCIACHAVRRKDATPLAEPSVPLPLRLEDKYTHDTLTRFLRRPLDVRPSGRMPDLKLSGREADDIAHYLLQNTKVPGTLRYALYRGRFETLDPYFESELRRTGLADGFDPSIARRGNDFALRFDGFLEVPREGKYRFFLRSDDGSRLRINGELIVDNDGHRRNQRAKDAEGAIDLPKGLHALELTYFQRVRNRVLTVEWQGPGIARGPIPSDALRSTREIIETPPPFVVDPARAERGKGLFTSEGCVACHAAERPAARPDGTTPLLELRAGEGCTSADAVRGPMPDYRLSPDQRRSIDAALSWLKTHPDSPPTGTRVTRRITAFNCYACHERDGVGGPSEAREPWFTSGGHNQGMEGRIPPRLTGVGDKLKRAWLQQVLRDGASTRPLFHTRMPRYGDAILEGLADDLIETDRRASTPPASADDLQAQRAAGRQLVGAVDGFNCVACHHFRGSEGATMQMVDLTGVTERVHEDWFQRWIRAPERFLPGTRMPSYLPHGDVLGGDLDRQFAAIWTYLADGRRALRPKGVSRQNLELTVGGEAIVYRGKLRDVGFRGIAVGHPELAHVAFDAKDMRYALLWRGRFLDVRAHWTSQSMGRIGPRGHDVIKLPKGPSWTTPEGPARTRFRGYKLAADEIRRPTFRYDVGELRVEDHTRALEGGAGIVRTLTFAGTPPAGLSLRLAQGPASDKRLAVTVKGATPDVMERDGVRTTSIPVSLATKTVEVTYRW